MRLSGARIAGQLNCVGGRFENPGGDALSAESAESDSVFLSKSGDGTDGFHATGEARLPGATIRSQLICDGGRFENPDGKALNLQEARANSLWLRDLSLKTAGEIVLVGTEVYLLADDSSALASQGVFFA